MPTSSADDEEIEEIYEEPKKIIQTVKGEENLIVIRDWNSVVGKGREGKIVGEYGLGRRNVQMFVKLMGLNYGVISP